MALYQMTGKEAGDLMAADKDAVLFPINSFLTQFGLTWDELHVELRAGRIVASAVPEGKGYIDITISAKALLDWIGNVDSPPHLVDKVMGAMGVPGRPPPRQH